MTAAAAWTPYRVRAANTAVASENKIHDDEVARRFGFRGGLVPGVDVYAYLTHPVVAAWGRPWLERGTIAARFAQPVYDGDEVEVRAEPAGGASAGGPPEVALTLHDGRGELCATATAALPDEPATSPDPARYPVAPLPDDPPPASPETLAAADPLGTVEATFRAERAPEYLDDVREGLPLYRTEGLAHPGWLLRFANHALAANVVLGPWIHVASEVRNWAAVRDGRRVAARGRVAELFERKGHRFVVLDVLMVADDSSPVLQVRHTAVYQPRAADRGTADR
ncbi:MAG: hypothetical protein M5U14_04235 [Acidimicrobiia bacterium]|nr:hypothetical protein [Acidimicrobiia bacterium]